MREPLSPAMRASFRRVVVVVSAACLAWLGTLAVARAQASVAGTWDAGATTIDVTVESWGPDCGPKPQSTRLAGAGRVHIEEAGGVLIIHGRDGDIRSDQCRSPNPQVKKLGSSHGLTTWITRCKTPAADPRQEQTTYTLRIDGPSKLLYQDISHFDWKLNTSTCVATFTTTQTLSREGGAAAPAPATTPTQTPTPPVPAAAAKPGVPSRAAKPVAPAPTAQAPAAPPCVPGAPARLSLRPRKADIQLGQRVCFEARVADEKGCVVPNATVSWSLNHDPGIRGKLEGGCFRAAEGSAEGEGSFKVIASFHSMRADAPVEVSASTLPALIAARLGSGAIEGETQEPAAEAANPAISQAAPTSAPVAATRMVARSVAVPRDDERRLMRFGALGAVLLAAAVAALFFILRRRSQSFQLPASAPVPAMPDRSLRCPRCGTIYPADSAFCGNDGSALEPAS